MNIFNRQVNTGFNKQTADGMMLIEVQENAKIGGKNFVKGAIIKATRSEARRLFAINSKVFKIKMD